jgi:Rps23 Pro-64 3,4-dihydroxylase Tpa1-like proline 4-hydroxylase
MTKTLKIFLIILGALCVAIAAEESVPSAPQCAPGEQGNCDENGEDYDDNVDYDEDEDDDDEPEIIPREEMHCSGVDPDFCLEDHGWGIQNYLSPHVMKPETLHEISENLRNGKVVVLRDAFIPEFAEAMHHELKDLNFVLEERYDDEGFHVVQHNIFQMGDYTKFMVAADTLFMSEESKAFMHQLSGRDCSGNGRTTASWFAPKGYVLPHSDHRESRVVSFVWHLSKDWRPEWGGALHFSKEEAEHSYVHASFNTLSVFSVHPNSMHMVTPVSPYATEKRLTWNGWFNSGWYPSAEDDLVSHLDTPEKRRDLTEDQVVGITNLINDGSLDGVGNHMKARVDELMALRHAENFPPPKLIHTVQA